jgi:dimethylaniline monooxygenase (N-oxide forming)
MTSKRICIIGGGASGITAAKACIEEGHDYVIYEMYHTFGGLWRYRDEDVNGLASVAAATIINSSKEMSAFSDFPPKADYPNYMHNTRMIEYIEDYAKHVGCRDKMYFEHKVLKCEKSATFDQDGSWSVTIENMKTKQTFTETFDGVMVCTGHHVTPSWAHFPGQDKFKGQIIHTHSYKKPNEFVGKRVVVVGIGNSGGDVAVELSMVNPKVLLSTRRGAWVVHRVGMKGKPFDTLFLRRWINFLFNHIPYRMVCSTAENFINFHFDHSQYRIKPQHRIFEQHITVNDALPNRVLSGTIELKNDIERITETGVIFKGETEETPCDVIIMATGYKVDFPFIDQSLVPVVDNKVDLYKYVFAPNLQPHPETLAFIALAQPIGALFPIAEMHSRWFALVMSGKVKLPSQEAMLKDIEKKHKYIESRYYGGPRNTLQVDWINYMDELAELIGCKPKVSKYLFKDPKLWWQLVFGPCFPYQYRLTGPHKWDGARECLLEANRRIKAPLYTRELTDKNNEFIKDKPHANGVRNGYKKIE